jgi:TPR repeat protein
LRDEQLAAAEAALRRGDQAVAAELLAPLAAAGVSRAQAMLGRMHEARAGRPNYFEAYVWYGMATRAGEPGASAQKDRVARELQPAEIEQAERVIKRWKPSAELAGGSPN